MAAFICASLASCGLDNKKSISLDREVILPAGHGGTRAITKLAGGELVVTGIGRSAWVLATDSEGALLWEYRDPIDERNTVQGDSQTEYLGAVPLSNGNVLLCGYRNHEIGRSNLILILDRNGKLVEQREEKPGIETSYRFSAFQDCQTWEGGLMLRGVVNLERTSMQWLLLLDANGKKREEHFFTLADTPVDYSDGAGVTYSLGDARENLVTFYRVTLQGKVVAKRVTKVPRVSPITTHLRTIEPTNNSYVVAKPFGGKPVLYALNSRLDDVVPPQEIYDIDISQGMGLVTPEGALALFGRTSDAAIAWVSPDRQLSAVRGFDSNYRSYTVKDAVALSNTKFVTVRDGASQSPLNVSVLMDWISIK